MVTITCRKNEPAIKIVPKYDNLDDFDVTPENPILPNGVYGYRHLRQTNPLISALSPLAKWLVEQLDGKTICGLMPGMHNNIKIETAMSEATARRYIAGVYGLSHTHYYEDIQRALDDAESWIKMYDMDSEILKIKSFLLPIIEPDESDETYWNSAAEMIVATGGIRVIINKNSFDLPKNNIGILFTHNFSGKTVRIPLGVEIKTVEQAIAQRAIVAENERIERLEKIERLKKLISESIWWKKTFAELWVKNGCEGKPRLRNANFVVPSEIYSAANVCGKLENELLKI